MNAFLNIGGSQGSPTLTKWGAVRSSFAKGLSVQTLFKTESNKSHCSNDAIILKIAWTFQSLQVESNQPANNKIKDTDTLTSRVMT